MKLFFRQNKYQFYILVIFLIAELIVNPIGEFPLNDDWAYAEAVMSFLKSGVINFGNFPAMTLFTHLLWGSLFTKIFGFSLFLLRLSTLISAYVGLWFLFKLIHQITENNTVSLLACLVLLFNPIYFNLSNTFMTDVSFCSLTIICVYLAHNYFLTRKPSYFYGFVISAVFLMLTRQYGIIIPFCFLAAALFDKGFIKKTISMSLFAILVVYFSLRIYEVYLKAHLPSGSEYKFSSNIKIFDDVFWIKFWYSLTIRYKEIAQHLFVYIAPLAIFYFKRFVSETNVKLSIFLLVNTLFLTLLFFTGYISNSISIFSNMMLGPETFYESFKGARHNSFPLFDTWLYAVKFLLSFISIFVISAALISAFTRDNKTNTPKPILVFLISFLVLYIFMLLITESYFDRYHLPLIIVFLLLFVWLLKAYTIKVRFGLIALIIFALFAILGTKDYLEWNRQRWAAYHYLRAMNVERDKINAGFEPRCWNEGVGKGLKPFLELEGFDYLIQFNGAERFKPIKEFPFQRYFPFRKDKIVVFKRE